MMKLNFALFFLCLGFLAFTDAARRKKQLVRIRRPEVVFFGQDIRMTCEVRNRRLKFGGFYKIDASGNEVRIIADGLKYNLRSRYRRNYLFVSNFGKEDVGNYSCKAGKEVAVAYISPKGKFPDSPTAVFLAKTYHVEKGKSITLYCVTKGPFDGFYYESSSKPYPIRRSSRYGVYNDGKDLFGWINRLVIKKAESNSKFYCRSGNFLASANVIVHKNVRRSVYFASDEINARKDSRVMLRCIDKKRAGADIYRVDPTTGSLIKQSPARKSSMSVTIYKKSSVADAGYYLCKAGRNTAVARYNYQVSSPSNNGEGDPVINKGKDAVITLSIPIENARRVGSGAILRWSKIVTTSSGSRKFTKLASMFGPLKATSDKRYQWKETGGGLIIKNVTEDDAGYYNVQLIKSGSYETQTFRVKVV